MVRRCRQAIAPSSTPGLAQRHHRADVEAASAAVESPARYEATPRSRRRADVDDFGPIRSSLPGRRMRLRIPADALRSLAAPILRWSLRVASRSPPLLAIVAGAGWMARPYVVKLLTVAKTGTVVLESVPPGSDVFVDGVALGPSPLTTELSTGSHVVEFRKGRCDSETRDRCRGRSSRPSGVSTGPWRPPGA